MMDVKQDDLALFDNVAYVNASENFLAFGKGQCLLCLHTFSFVLLFEHF